MYLLIVGRSCDLWLPIASRIVEGIMNDKPMLFYVLFTGRIHCIINKIIPYRFSCILDLRFIEFFTPLKS